MSPSCESDTSEEYRRGYQDGKTKAWHDADEVNYSAWGGRVETAEEELKQTRAELDSLKRQLQDTQKDLRESQDSVKALEAEMKKHQALDIQDRGSQCEACPRLASCQAEVRQLRAQVADLEANAGRSQPDSGNDTQRDEQESQDMQNRIRTLEEEQQETYQKQVMAEQDLQDTEAELRRVKEHNCRLEAELRLAQRRKSSPNGEEQSLESELDGLEEQQKSPESDKHTSETASGTTSPPSSGQQLGTRPNTYVSSEENESHIDRLLDHHRSHTPTYGLAPALARSRQYGGRGILNTSRKDDIREAPVFNASNQDHAAELKSCKAELEISARLVRNLRESIAKNDLLLHKAKDDLEVVILTAQEIRAELDVKTSELQEIKARQERRRQQKKSSSTASVGAVQGQKSKVEELQGQVNELWTTLDTKATELAVQLCETSARTIRDLRSCILNETGCLQEACEDLQSTGTDDVLDDNNALLSHFNGLVHALEKHHQPLNDVQRDDAPHISSVLTAEIEQMRDALDARQASLHALMDTITTQLQATDAQHGHGMNEMSALVARIYNATLARHASLLETLQDP